MKSSKCNHLRHEVVICGRKFQQPEVDAQVVVQYEEYCIFSQHLFRKRVT